MIRIHNIILVLLHTSIVETHSKLKALLPYILRDTKQYLDKKWLYILTQQTCQDTWHARHWRWSKKYRLTTYYYMRAPDSGRGRETNNTIYSTTKKGVLRVQNLNNIRHDQTQTVTLTFKIWLIKLSHFFCYFRHTFSSIYVIVNDCLPSLRHISYIYVQTKWTA